jgi:hypothetical protein
VFPELSGVPDAARALHEPAAWTKVGITTLRLALQDIDRKLDSDARAQLRSEVVALIEIAEERTWPL